LKKGPPTQPHAVPTQPLQPEPAPPNPSKPRAYTTQSICHASRTLLQTTARCRLWHLTTTRPEDTAADVRSLQRAQKGQSRKSNIDARISAPSTYQLFHDVPTQRLGGEFSVLPHHTISLRIILFTYTLLAPSPRRTMARSARSAS
jgi:hypothetical protein